MAVPTPRGLWNVVLLALASNAACSSSDTGNYPSTPSEAGLSDAATDTSAESFVDHSAKEADTAAESTSESAVEASEEPEVLDSSEAEAEAATPSPCAPATPLPSWAEAPSAGASLVVHTATMDLYLSALAEGVARLQYTPTGQPLPSDRPWALLTQPPTDTNATVSGFAGGAQLCTTWLTMQVSAEGRLRILDSDSTVLLEDPAGGGWKQESETLEGGAPTVTTSVVRSTPTTEAFYGFGEHTGPLERRGQHLVFWNTDPYQSTYGGWAPDADPLYQSIPFFLGLRGTRAYGVLTNNTHRLEMDIAHKASDLYSIKAFGGILEQYVFPGPSMAEVLKRYAVVTGPSALPPRWALGYHQSRWGYSPAAEFEKVGQEFRTRKIPADGLWLDIQHLHGFRTFTWDPATFPDAATMIQSLAQKGYKVVVITDPALKQEPGWGVYDSGLAGGHFLRKPNNDLYVGVVWAGPSVFPDFTSSATRAWWGKQLVPNVDLGVRGFWLDVNEPTVFPESTGGSLPLDLVAEGEGTATTMQEAHNVYALQEARATWEGMVQQAPSRRPFLLSRAGFAGIQRYAAVWTGDAPSTWTTLGQTLPMLLNLGLSGVPLVGSDVGGYSGNASSELFARWMALGSVSPFFRGHVTSGVPGQEPWAFGQEVEDVSRALIRQRYEFLPYLYSLVADNLQTGAPVLRPLVYEFQTDPTVYRIEDEAMLGPFLLFAPVVQANASEREVRLPAGRWYELHSGALYEGPVTLQLGITLAALPAYVREGAILPRAPAMQWSDESPLSPLTLELYPSPKESSFTFYEDAGDGFDYSKGISSRVTYTLQQTATGARLTAGPREGTWQPPARTLLLRVRRVDHVPTQATFNSSPLTQHFDEPSLLQAGVGWWYDEQDLSLLVSHPDTADFQLDLSYDLTIPAPRPAVQVEFEVEVPVGTPTTDTIHIALSSNNWTQTPLAWGLVPNQAKGTVSVPRGEWFFYKFTRGDWNTVEKWAGCVEATNRYGFGAAHPVRQDVVATWRDWCP